MLKIVKIKFYLLSLAVGVYLAGCSAGDYELEKYEVSYTEKSVKVDTLKKITVDNTNDRIKEDKKETTKEVYTYAIQIGAFSLKNNFDNFYNQAKMQLGEDVYFEQTNTLYKVRVGNFPNRAEAIKFIELIRSKGYNDAFIVTKRN